MVPGLLAREKAIGAGAVGKVTNVPSRGITTDNLEWQETCTKWRGVEINMAIGPEVARFLLAELP